MSGDVDFLTRPNRPPGYPEGVGTPGDGRVDTERTAKGRSVMKELATTALHAARRAKHLGFVALKWGRSVRTQSADSLLRLRASRSDYVFDLDRHRDAYGDFPRMYFLHRPSGVEIDPTTPPPRRVFCFWTGENAMSEARRAAFDAMEADMGVPVTLITPENLSDWIVPGAPLHPTYESLSSVHRSDYLRAYFMWHYGGGYSDIKRPTSQWVDAWDAFADPKVWISGYPEVSSRSCGGDGHTSLGREIHRNFPRLVGFGAFIVRPKTPFAREWIREIERRLDYYYEELRAAPGGTWGEEKGYPLKWIEIGSDVFHPLQLKYLRHVHQEAELLPNLFGHR